jgi:DMSO/TMAO reductase YedYZ heme-binding membrane subunit
MISLLVAALMWLLVASLVILRRGRAERNISYAALTIAVGMTLGSDQVYRPLDKLAGGANYATLPADLALMVGVFFLGRGVLKASAQRSGPVRFALGKVMLATALLGAVSMFLLIDGGATTTNFMLDLGDQPSAGAYSMIQFTYYAIVLAAMAVLAARQIRRREGAQRLPPTSLVVGSFFGVLLSVVVITMDIAHLAGDLSLMRAVSVAYGPLHMMTFVLLCVGFAGQPAARALRARSRDRQAGMLVTELEPLWVAATAARPGISHKAHGDARPEPETFLHRQVVEIRDAVMDARVAFELSDHDRYLIDRAERHLLGGDSSGSVPVASQATSSSALQ